MTEYNPPYGYALRREGGCLKNQTSCGPTAPGFYACCPGEASCPGAAKTIANNVCCPSDADCTPTLEQYKHCADPSWEMIQPGDGAFCCEAGMIAYEIPGTGVGCSETAPDDADATVFPTTDQAFASSTASSSSSKASATTTSTTTIHSNTASPTGDSGSHDSSSGTDTGVIVGATIGGVAGLAIILAALWFFFFRKSKRSSQASPQSYAQVSQPGDLDGAKGYYGSPPPPTEMDTMHDYSEIGQGQTPPQELDAGSYHGSRRLS